MTWRRDTTPEELDRLGTGQTPFAAPDAGLEEPSDEPDEGEQFGWSDIEPFLDELPAVEADCMTLYYGERLSQLQIALVLKQAGVVPTTQAGVSYRIGRGRKRIQFLRTIPKRETDREVFASDLEPWLRPDDVEAVWQYYRLTCQSAAAAKVGTTQGKVRMKLLRFMKRIEAAEREFIRADRARGRVPEVPDLLARYLQQFRALVESYNVLHGVVGLPKGEGR